MSPLDRVSGSVDLELASRDLEGEFVIQSIGQTGYGRSSTDEDDVLQQDGTMVRIHGKDAVVHQVGESTQFV